MALNINGTTGISGVDGSASAPALTGTDSNTGINFASDTVNINTGGVTRASIDSAGKLSVTSTSTAANDSEPVATFTTQGHSQIRLNGDGNQWSLMALDSSAAGNNFIFYDKNNSAERMRIDSSGNVGIGSTSPTDYDNAADNLVVKGSGNTGITVATTNTASNTSLIFSDGTSNDAQKVRGAVQYLHNGDAMRFLTSSAEHLRIGSDGFLGIGVTSEVTTGGGACFINASDARKTLILGTNTSGTRTLLAFQTSQGSAGFINVSGSTTAYNTSSDYRLKENVVAISDGITRLKTLKPCRFNFIADATKTVDGFLAHEVTAVPEAISGTKDQVVTQDLVDSGDKKESELGNPIYQGIDQSKLVPLLTAALQEAVAKIEVLETKVAALEAA